MLNPVRHPARAQRARTAAVLQLDSAEFRRSSASAGSHHGTESWYGNKRNGPMKIMPLRMRDAEIERMHVNLDLVRTDSV